MQKNNAEEFCRRVMQKNNAERIMKKNNEDE
jgi:hypothetical protein